MDVLFLKVTKTWRTGMIKTLEPFGITLPAYALLRALYSFVPTTDRPPTQKQVADIVNLDLNVTSQTVKFLVKHHLVNRAPSATDSRAYVLTLTLAGSQIALQTQAAVRRFQADFLADVDLDAFRLSLNALL